MRFSHTLKKIMLSNRDQRFHNGSMQLTFYGGQMVVKITINALTYWIYYIRWRTYRGFEPWEPLKAQRFLRPANWYSVVVIGVKYARKHGFSASLFVMLCQHFQEKPRHGLVTAGHLASITICWEWLAATLHQRTANYNARSSASNIL